MSLSYVVLTAPTSEAAEAQQLSLQFLRRRLPALRGCECVCVSDPRGARVGSGGGTLNALAALIEKVGKERVLASNVAIIHSGGDSRRSPLHSVTGKAWSTLNCSYDTHGKDVDSEIKLYSSPLTVLLSELSDIISRLPQPVLGKECVGSVVVASSDVLISLELPPKYEFPALLSDSVSVITVPECVHIAKNHGVLGGCAKEIQEAHAPNNVNIDVFPANCYLQKPSLEEMAAHNVILPSEDMKTCIDTGLVIASGRAYEKWIALLQHPAVKHCTFHALSSGNSATSSTPLRLELYSDILLALSLNDGHHNSFLSYLRRLKATKFGGMKVPNDNSEEVTVFQDMVETYFEDNLTKTSVKELTLHDKGLLAVWCALRECSLIGVHCHKGVFCHLGTSSEHKQLLLSPTINLDNANEAEELDKLKIIQTRYDLQASVHSLLCIEPHDLPSEVISGQMCLINSLINLHTNSNEDKKVLLGPGTVIENSFLHGECCVGSNCIISFVQPVLGQNLVVPSDIMLQQIPLIKSWEDIVGVPYDSDTGSSSHCVILTLGINDNVKAEYKGSSNCNESCGFCGTPWLKYFQTYWKSTVEERAILIAESDIWTNDCPEKTLWTARLFPVISLAVGEKMCPQEELLKLRSVATWFWSFVALIKSPSGNIIDSDQLPDMSQLGEIYSLVEQWRALPRLSLSQLLKCGSAESMNKWKRFLVGSYYELAESRSTQSFFALSHPLRNLGKMKESSRDDCLNFSKVYFIAEQMLFEVCSCLSNMSSSLLPKTTHRKIEQEAVSLCLALLIIRLCGIFSDTGSEVNVAVHHLRNISLFDPLPKSVFDCTNSDFLADTAVLFQKMMHVVDSSIESICERTGDVSLLLSYVARMVDLHSPTPTLLRLLRLHSGCLEPSQTISIPTINAAHLPRLLLFLALVSRANIFATNCERLGENFDSAALFQHYHVKEAGVMKDISVVIAKGSTAILKSGLDILLTSPTGDEKTSNSQLAETAILEKLQQMVRFQLYCSTLHNFKNRKHSDIMPVPSGQILQPATTGLTSAAASAPFRIDLAGGWSDTPPITYEYAGTVVNIAVDVMDYCDGVANDTHFDRPVATLEPSLHCKVSYLDEPVILLTSRMRSSVSFSKHGAQSSDYMTETVTCSCLSDFQLTPSNCEDGIWTKSGALLRACIIALGLLQPPSESITCSTLAEALRFRCGGNGLHLISSSSVPIGSGLGSSSILIAVVIKALWKLIGEDGTKSLLVDLVGQVEQILRTGGGWQDQVGGVYGGLKVGNSNGSLPLTVDVEPIALSASLKQKLEQRMCLVYSGVARVARDTLLKVLAKYATQSFVPSDIEKLSCQGGEIPRIIETARNLQNILVNVEDCTKSVEDQDRLVDAIACHVRSYWQQKKLLAPGTETEFLKYLMHRLDIFCLATSACGAGAGGFIVCFLRRGVSMSQLASLLNEVNAECDEGDFEKNSSGNDGVKTVVSLHPVHINLEGVE